MRVGRVRVAVDELPVLVRVAVRPGRRVGMAVVVMPVVVRVRVLVAGRGVAVTMLVALAHM